MTLSTWIEFIGSIADDARASILSLLEASDIHATTQTRAAPVGLAVFDVVDDRLFELLRNESRRAAMLALSVGGNALTSQTLWSLMHAGASDALQWLTLPDDA